MRDVELNNMPNSIQGGISTLHLKTTPLAQARDIKAQIRIGAPALRLPLNLRFKGALRLSLRGMLMLGLLWLLRLLLAIFQHLIKQGLGHK